MSECCPKCGGDLDVARRCRRFECQYDAGLAECLMTEEERERQWFEEDAINETQL